MRNFLLIAILATCPCTVALAWDGYDYTTGGSVEIGQGNLVREGEDIEYFDWNAGQYRYGTVEDVSRGLGSVDVEIYDHDSGEYRTFEMDDGGYSMPGLPGLPGLE